KCSFCNFASDVFSRGAYRSYVDRVSADISQAELLADRLGVCFEGEVDSIYLGGGTPTVLDPVDLERIFESVRSTFSVSLGAEISVECAPGTLTGTDVLPALLGCGVNRVSLGVQSFVDRESASVGRLHNREVVLQDVQRLGAAGISNINIDLIAGLPHQNEPSWNDSLQEALNTGAGHVSVYMLEIDDESRLGRELLAGGTKYHAHFVPDEELSTKLYLQAEEVLRQGGVAQYEISNFARPGCESRHNLKYWTRKPYLGFGVDAHSMLLPKAADRDLAALRFATSDSLDGFMAAAPVERTPVSRVAALEESFFLGLRLTRGVDLDEVAAEFGGEVVESLATEIGELVDEGLLTREGSRIALTSRGRMLSNEVFARFLVDQDEPRAAAVAP
ncbi:MAG: radical SAM family heme chaperone HemW, partial [Acidobacteriales bacterium]|nr:radical SAM family heme chaperone HemW [Terriglobales bacterium]